MFKKQRELQERLKTPLKPEDPGYQENIRVMTLAAIDELMEALRETPWKPWKKQQVLNPDNFKKELIDAWHFLINLSLLAGMGSEELYNLYMGKNQENFKRQESGY
jgi:dimeric dUTPase (all-alpha-NTP-PPase superfamily)